MAKSKTKKTSEGGTQASTPRTITKTETPGAILQLSPEQILRGSNVRFGLKESRILSLMDNIAEVGGVMQPVQVGAPNEDGLYPLITGEYRTECVARLNEDGADLPLPAIVVTDLSELDRLKRQISENRERENQSAMDEAVAIKQLMDAGVDKMRIRTIFARPSQTKNGNPEPTSNSFVNMRLSFLEFPKKIQTMIHEGSLPVKSAYFLTREPKEKWDTILERARASVASEGRWEDKEEQNYLKTTRLVEKAGEEATTAKMELEEAKAALEKAEYRKNETAEEVTKTLRDRNTLPPQASAEEKKAADKAFRDSQAVALAARKEYDKKHNDHLKLKDKNDRMTQKAEAVKERVQKAREAKAGPPIPPAAIAKASKDEGSKAHVQPTITEIKTAFKELDINNVTPKVRMIAKALVRFCTGETTENQLYRELQEVVGETPKTKK